MKLSRIPAEILIALLRGYKRVLSPLFLPSCRYTPTCSEYALEAVDRHGAVCGSVLAIWRLLRCHPFANGGYDPVPMDKNSASCGVPLRRTHSTPSVRSVAQGRLAEGRCPHAS